MHHDAANSLRGTVEKIIKPIQGEAEKVQIAIQSGDDPKQKFRIANILVDARGEAVSLKTGAVTRRFTPLDYGSIPACLPIMALAVGEGLSNG